MAVHITTELDRAETKANRSFFFLSYGKRRRARDSIGFGLWRFLPHVPLTTNEWFPCGGPLPKSLPLLLSFAYSGLCVFSVVAGQRVTTKLGRQEARRDVIQMENCLEIEQNSHLICFVAAVCTRSSALHRKQSNADALPLGRSPQRKAAAAAIGRGAVLVLNPSAAHEIQTHRQAGERDESE